MRNLSYENEFYTQFLFHANKSHFHKNGFALRLALKQRHKGTRKWPIIPVFQPKNSTCGEKGPREYKGIHDVVNDQGFAMHFKHGQPFGSFPM